MRYCIFGGSFDPPHAGHRSIADCAVNTLNLDTLFWVPSPNPPHKNKPGTDFEHRLAMTRIFLQDVQNQTVSDIEKFLPAPSYSITTINALQEKFGVEHEWFFLIGADNWKIFPSWHQPAEILKKVTLVIFPREGVVLNSLPTNVIELTTPNINISSTQIRTQLESGVWLTQSKVPEEIKPYIVQHHLYGINQTL